MPSVKIVIYELKHILLSPAEGWNNFLQDLEYTSDVTVVWAKNLSQILRKKYCRPNPYSEYKYYFADISATKMIHGF